VRTIPRPTFPLFATSRGSGLSHSRSFWFPARKPTGCVLLFLPAFGVKGMVANLPAKGALRRPRAAFFVWPPAASPPEVC